MIIELHQEELATLIHEATDGRVVNFRFGPQGAWLNSEESNPWVLRRLAEMRKRFVVDQNVWAAGRPATIVAFLEDVSCGAHPGEYAYGVRFAGTGENWSPWPYCESQLSARD